MSRMRNSMTWYIISLRLWFDYTNQIGVDDDDNDDDVGNDSNKIKASFDVMESEVRHQQFNFNNVITLAVIVNGVGRQWTDSTKKLQNKIGASSFLISTRCRPNIFNYYFIFQMFWHIMKTKTRFSFRETDVKLAQTAKITAQSMARILNFVQFVEADWKEKKIVYWTSTSPPTLLLTVTRTYFIIARQWLL